jgi:uncharacterized membrane protein
VDTGEPDAGRSRPGGAQEPEDEQDAPHRLDLPVRRVEPTAKAWRQLSGAVVVGVLTGLVVGLATPVTAVYAVLLGYDVAVVTYLVWVWRASWRLNAEATAEAAVQEDPSRSATDLILLVASVASLAAVAFSIADAAHSHGAGKALRVVLGVSLVVFSWFLLHTLFTVKYARNYYAGRDGDIDFNMDGPPVWSDFAYLSFTIGMTFQVSDTDLHTTTLRRVALRHMLLSYLFGAVIIAVAINLVAGLTK